MATWTTTEQSVTWTAVDDPSVTWTVNVNPTVTGGGGADLSNTAPQDLGTAAAGVSTEASRADHVHDMPSAADVGADAAGAAAAAQAAAVQRSNHTGSQAISTVSGLQAALDSKAASANALGYVNHGATAGTTRPTGYAAVVWVGTVEPTNAVNGDIWENPS